MKQIMTTSTGSTGSSSRAGSLPSQAVMGLVRFYQLTIGVVLPPSCRFTPTCSEYTLEAVARFGVVRGLWMGTRRICRCHPFHPGGHDPVERGS